MAKKKSGNSSTALTPPRTKKIAGVDEWEVRGAVDTLVRAEQIKHDAKLMNAVQIEAKRQAQAIKKVAGKGK